MTTDGWDPRVPGEPGMSEHWWHWPIGRVRATSIEKRVVTRSEEVWAEALRDPGFRAALDEGLADVAAGRTSKWSQVKARLLPATRADPARGRHP